MSKITWTKIDEAPALASYSLLPIIQSFAKTANIEIETRDISLSGRVIAYFSDYLKPEQRINDELSELGKLVKEPSVNIIKLPNISASLPQLKATIKELQSKGYALPDFPENPENEEETKIKKIYSKALGSAVNPVLREGNSDRRAPQAVKNYAQKFPHSVEKWSTDSKAHVASMSSGDFCSNEESSTMNEDSIVKISFVGKKGETVLKDKILLEKDEIVDYTFMSKQALVTFFEEQIQDAKYNVILFSLHMKATMMKVSDPIIFGHAVKVYFKEAIAKHQDTIAKLAINFNNGLGDLYNKINILSTEEQDNIKANFSGTYDQRADIAMVNSDKGITNLHVPSDVIIDASMPSAIRNGGKMWNKNGELHDAKFVIPDSTYSPLYDETIKNCIANGELNPTELGTVQNVGLMAQKAEEYGSHGTTFEIPEDGELQVTNDKQEIIYKKELKEGDIWRMVRVKDAAIRDWIKLAITRAKATKWKTIFWLNDERPHDQELQKKVILYSKDYDTQNLDIETLSVREAAKLSVEKIRCGENTISVTGNVLRDYNTDLYPILEVGTSAKMLSIVPLMNGGGLFETGAGGSAPKHVEQLQKENYLRWDSLGEFLALVPSLEKIKEQDNNQQAQVLATALDIATEKLLENNKSPQRKLGTLDNRGSHFYLALYWAEALSQQSRDSILANKFEKIYKQLLEKEKIIVQELLTVQGHPADIGGYYKPEIDKVVSIMRPSSSFNEIIDNIS